MDVELIKKISKTKYLHSVAKIAAKESYMAKLLITTQGGTFRATPELISFLSIKTLGTTVVVSDIYDNPVSVSRQKLLSQCIEIYKQATESWLSSVEEINRQR